MHPALNLPDFPQRPDEVPDDAPREELVDAYERHLAAAVLADRPPREPVAPADVPRHALAALAIVVSLVRGLTIDRWAAVRAALLNGATLAQVAAAVDEPAADVAESLARWAGSRVANGAMDTEEYVRLLTLVADDRIRDLAAEPPAVLVPAADVARLRDDAEHVLSRTNPSPYAQFLAGRILDVLGRAGGAR